MSFLSSTPIPFFISDPEHKKKIERIQEDYLWRMPMKDEKKFYVYLDTLIKVRENNFSCMKCGIKFYSLAGLMGHCH